MLKTANWPVAIVTKRTEVREKCMKVCERLFVSKKSIEICIFLVVFFPLAYIKRRTHNFIILRVW